MVEGRERKSGMRKTSIAGWGWERAWWMGVFGRESRERRVLV
jgi:hypothetical protein